MDYIGGAIALAMLFILLSGEPRGYELVHAWLEKQTECAQ